MRVFFLISQIFWMIGQVELELNLLDENENELSRIYIDEISLRYILKDSVSGIGIWIWAVENLQSSHHASIVREQSQLYMAWPI
jgi:hypothetical protein